jgi:hypothetical protein
MELFAMSVLQTPSHCRAIPFCVLLLLLLDDFWIGQALCHDCYSSQADCRLHGQMEAGR